MKRIILDKIREYSRIFLFRHIRVDGDCVGATKGMKALIKATWPEKEVYIIDSEKSEYLAFLGPDDASVPDEMYADALAIVIDVGSADRISSDKYTLCREIVKIDHHIERDPYGDYNWVEEERSSACEMIAAFYEAFQDELAITPEAAMYIYTGMVTDSGRFRYEGVNGDTMRLAGLMLDQGFDTEMLYAHLYMKDFDSLKFKAHVFANMCVSENGVAYIRISYADRGRFGLSFEEACAAISYLEGIRGCLIWLAFIEAEDSIRVRLRSRFLPVNGVAEHFRGGGHACASGATVYDDDEVRALIAEADALLKEYKETHEGWL